MKLPKNEDRLTMDKACIAKKYSEMAEVFFGFTENGTAVIFDIPDDDFFDDDDFDD